MLKEKKMPGTKLLETSLFMEAKLNNNEKNPHLPSHLLKTIKVTY